MSYKKCPYCGGMVVNDVCNHCGAPVPPSKQIDVDGEPAPPPFVGYNSIGYEVDPIPWEQVGEIGLWTALTETIKEVLGTPEDFFSRLSPSGGIGNPLSYGFIMGVVGLLFANVWALIAKALGFGVSSMMGGDFSNLMAQSAGGILAIVFSIIGFAIAIPVWLFVYSGILHVTLMLLGGAEEGYQATFRCICYSQTALIFQIIPLVGNLIAVVSMIILIIKSIATIHDIPTGKVLLAIFLPALICCILFVPFMCMIGGLAGAAESCAG